MSAVFQRKIDGTGPGAAEVPAVEGSRGKEGASSQTKENAGKRPVKNKECVSTSFLKERKRKSFGRMPRKKTGRDTRPMATRVSCQRISGTSKK